MAVGGRVWAWKAAANPLFSGHRQRLRIVIGQQQQDKAAGGGDSGGDAQSVAANANVAAVWNGRKVRLNCFRPDP